MFVVSLFTIYRFERCFPALGLIKSFPNPCSHKQNKRMKKALVLLSCITGVLTLTLVNPTFGAEEKTITGEGKCAKCSLKETDSCQNVIQAQEDGKTVNYYLAKNKVSKEFHDNICKETKKVTATGTVKEVDGKKELTASKIELVKE